MRKLFIILVFTVLNVYGLFAQSLNSPEREYVWFGGGYGFASLNNPSLNNAISKYNANKEKELELPQLHRGFCFNTGLFSPKFTNDWMYSVSGGFYSSMGEAVLNSSSAEITENFKHQFWIFSLKIGYVPINNSYVNLAIGMGADLYTIKISSSTDEEPFRLYDQLDNFGPSFFAAFHYFPFEKTTPIAIRINPYYHIDFNQVFYNSLTDLSKETDGYSTGGLFNHFGFEASIIYIISRNNIDNPEF